LKILLRQTDGPDHPDSIYSDRIIDGGQISFGASPDSDVQIVVDAVELNHFVIAGARGGAKLSSSAQDQVLLNGDRTKSSQLQVGDVIEVGGYRIEVVNPVAGVDLAVKVSRERVLPGRVERLYTTSLDKTGLSPRLFGWSLCIATLLFGLLLPLAYYFKNKPADAEGDINPTLARLSSSAGFMSDHFWTSGPLHAAHASLENSCNSCHKVLFEQVTDASCRDCHSVTTDHIEPVAEGEQSPHGFSNDRCGSCHREHNEPYSSLVIREDKGCIGCHADEITIADGSRSLPTAVAFSETDHPAFLFELTRPVDGVTFDTAAQWEKVRVDPKDAVETSQLLFDHEVHYQNDGLVDADGNAIQCATCHLLNDDGEHFEKMTYEKTCAGSGCHELNLDPSNRIPHGIPEAVVNTIKGYYLRTVGDSTQNFNLRIEDCRRRPGRNNCAPKCEGSPFECAMDQANRVVDEQFGVRGCVQCHLIDTNDDAVAEQRFKIAPVRLAEDYFPHSQFDHASHGVLVAPETLDTYTGDTACQFCHNAAESTSSSDVLLPGMDNCVECHDSSSEKVATVPLNCGSCHDYHLDN